MRMYKVGPVTAIPPVYPYRPRKFKEAKERVEEAARYSLTHASPQTPPLQKDR